MDKEKVVVFIDNIPDTKLIGFSEEGCTIWSDEDFHIDMQGITKYRMHRVLYILRVEINTSYDTPSRRQTTPTYVAICHAPGGTGARAPSVIKDALKFTVGDQVRKPISL